MEILIYILLATIFSPFIGVIIVSFRNLNYKTHVISIGITGITFLLSVFLWSYTSLFNFYLEPITIGFSISSKISFSLLLDSLNIPLIPLTALVYFLIIFSSSNVQNKRITPQRILFSEGLSFLTLLSPASLQLLLLLVMQIIIPYFEIKERKSCNRAFLIYMFFSSFLLFSGYLIGIVNPTQEKNLLLSGALISAGLLIRIGIFPVHSWLQDFVDKVSLSSAILFLTPLCPIYAFIRMVLPIAPTWALQSVALLSLLTSVYAAGINFVQPNIRRFYSNLFLSNASLVLVGLELATPIGISASLCIWLSVTLSLTGFGIALQCVESRIGRIKLNEFHGLYDQMPSVAGFFLITGLASIGFPLTIGFIALELLLEGATEVYPFVGTTIIITTALNGIAVLFAYFRLFTGRKVESSLVLNVKAKERIAIVVITILIIAGGLYPQPGLVSRFQTAHALVENRRISIERIQEVLNVQTSLNLKNKTMNKELENNVSLR